MSKNKVILYGHFGSGNIGNDSTFEAALYHVRKYRPDLEIVCVCSGPEEVTKRFDIQALPVSGIHSEEPAANGMISKVRRLFLRITDEVLFWIQRPRWFRPGDRFIVVGTGAVDDSAVHRPWHAPYELYKWSKTAKLGGAQVIFLSVGVGPIVNRVSKFLMLRALKQANYRSYREIASFNYLHGVGFDTSKDFLYPDLVFSFPVDAFSPPAGEFDKIEVVGLGLITYYGWQHNPETGESLYQEYFSKIKLFAVWLLQQGYRIRILYGDSTDVRSVDELVEFIRGKNELDWQSRLYVEKITNVNELFEQIAQTDIVVASRFHNVLCALMLERPVISIGYHEKNINLMSEMGLESYCQHIEKITFDKLVEQFQCYKGEMGQNVQQIHGRNVQYRKLLDEQYRNILLSSDTLQDKE